jgi:hypothetical protein
MKFQVSLFKFFRSYLFWHGLSGRKNKNVPKGIWQGSLESRKKTEGSQTSL